MGSGRALCSRVVELRPHVNADREGEPSHQLHPRHHRRRTSPRAARRVCHPLPAGAQRLPPHRPRQVHLPQLRPRARLSAASATSASTTPTPPPRTWSTSRPSSATSAGWASTGATSSSSPRTTTSGSTSTPSQLIEAGKAYVCSLSEEEIRKYRGTAFEPGIPSPYRDRSVAENLDLFRRMRAGEFADGAHVLRAKIDMASPNLKMRDWPLLPHPPRAPLPHRRRLVHLPPLRLRPLPLGPDRGHHPLHLHPRVREQPRALRLDRRRRAGARSPGAPRPTSTSSPGSRSTTVMTSKRKLLAARRERARLRLGRPAHAHPRRPAPPRLHGGAPSGTSAIASASPRTTARSSSPCWSTSSARISTSRPRACSPSSAPCAW